MRAKTNGGKVSRRSINQCPLRGTLRRAQRTLNVGSVEKPQTERHSRHRDHKRVLDCLKQCILSPTSSRDIPDGLSRNPFQTVIYDSHGAPQLFGSEKRHAKGTSIRNSWENNSICNDTCGKIIVKNCSQENYPFVSSVIILMMITLHAMLLLTFSRCNN